MSVGSVPCADRLDGGGKDTAPQAYPILNGIFLFLLLAGLATLASLEITPANAVRIPWLNRELPPTCVYVTRFGVPCPSCGITRSLIAAVHGDFPRSSHFHPAGTPLLLLVLAQCGMRIAFLRRQLRRPYLDVGVSVLMALYLAWVLNR